MPAKRSPDSAPSSASNPFGPYNNGRAAIDRTDIEPLFKQYHQPLARFAFRHLSMRHLSVADADDVVQETFLNLQERLSSEDQTFQPIGSGMAVVTYLCRSIANSVVDRFRHYQLGLQRGDYSHTSVEDEEAHLIPDSSPTPEETALINERRSLMRRALRNTGPRSAQILFAADFEGGYTTKELAALFAEGNENAAKMNLMRARNRFKDDYVRLLKSHGGNEQELLDLTQRGKRTAKGHTPRRSRATGS